MLATALNERHLHYPSEPEYACAHPDCETEKEWEQDRFALCEGCGSRFCKEHLKKVRDLDFCVTCAKCETCACGDAAVEVCDDCGNILCAGHARTYERGTGEDYKSGVRCSRGCAPLPPIVITPLEQVSVERCPF